MWNGGQSLQMGWLNLRLKEAESDFDFCQLSESGSVTLDRSGLVAVFTPEHARDHATGANKGTMRNPNMRMREDLTRFQTAPASPSSTTTHGGYPTPGAPTVPTTTVKPPTMLQNALGELADGYKLSAESIEKADLNYLNFFLEGISNARMSDMWGKRSPTGVAVNSWSRCSRRCARVAALSLRRTQSTPACGS